MKYEVPLTNGENQLSFISNLFEFNPESKSSRARAGGIFHSSLKKAPIQF